MSRAKPLTSQAERATEPRVFCSALLGTTANIWHSQNDASTGYSNASFSKDAETAHRSGEVGIYFYVP